MHWSAGTAPAARMVWKAVATFICVKKPSTQKERYFSEKDSGVGMILKRRAAMKMGSPRMARAAKRDSRLGMGDE